MTWKAPHERTTAHLSSFISTWCSSPADCIFQPTEVLVAVHRNSLSYFQTPQLIFTGASLLYILLFCIYVISPKKHYMWPSNDQVGANMLLVLTCLSHLTVNLLREGIFMSPIECPKMLSMVMAQKHLSNKSVSREVKLWLPDYESLYLWIFFKMDHVSL